jgi:predicted Zn-dependent protease
MTKIARFCGAAALATAALAATGHAAERGRSTAPTYARQLVDIANLYARRQQWERALQLLDEAHRAEPNRAATLEDLATACLHSAGCAPRRVALLNEVLQKAAVPARWLDDLVEELTRTGQRALAVRRLVAFVRQRPDDESARALLIDTAVEERQLDLAIEQLRLLIAARPGDRARRVQLAELLRDAGQRAAFGRELAALERDWPREPAVALLRIEVLIDAGQPRAAAEQLRALAAGTRLGPTEAARVAELEAELQRQRRDDYVDFRQSVRWAEFTDDLERR